MAYNLDTPQSALDHCLSYLRKLEDFAINGERVTYKGKEIKIKCDAKQHKEEVEGALFTLVKEKKVMLDELEFVKQALDSKSCESVASKHEAHGLTQRGHEGQSSPSVKSSTTNGFAASSLSNSKLAQQFLQNDGNVSHSELLKTRVEFPPDIHQQFLSQREANDDADSKAENSGMTTLRQFPSHTLRSNDPELLKIQIEHLKEENEELRKRQEKDTRQVLIQDFLNSMKKKTPKLTEEDTLRKLINRNAELIDRLSAEMNARIAANENSLENIAIQNRPTKVAEEYSSLMSNAWLDAKSMLDERSPEDKFEKRKNLFLVGVLEEAQKKATRHFKVLEEDMATRLKNPFESKTVPETDKKEKEHGVKSRERTGSVKGGEEHRQQLPSYVLSSVVDYLRQGADYVNLDPLIQKVHGAVLKRFAGDQKETEQVMNTPQFSSYIKQSTRLAWKMVIQKPPMVFNSDGIGKKWPGEKELDLALGSEPHKSGSVVQYYKYPSLFHGEKRMVKGVVFVQ